MVHRHVKTVLGFPRAVVGWVRETGRRMRERKITELQQRREILLLEKDTPPRASALRRINTRLGKLGGL